MSPTSIAVRMVFVLETGNAYTRAMKWFEDHPSEPYCFWGKNQLFGINDKNNKQLLKDNGIEDIESHTRVYKEDNDIVLRHFCDRYKISIESLISDGCTEGTDSKSTVTWTVEPEDDNYVLRIKKA